MKKYILLMLCISQSICAIETQYTQQEKTTIALVSAIDNNQSKEFADALDTTTPEILGTIIDETREILTFATQASTPEFLQSLQAHGVNLKKYFEEKNSTLYYQITMPETFEYIHKELKCAVPNDLLHRIVGREPDTETYHLVEFLLENCYVSANGIDEDDRTPLHHIHYWSGTSCCCTGDYEKHKQFIELLKRYDADVNACDYNGNTPLHVLSDPLVCPQVTRALIACGADPLRRNNAGHDPVAYRELTDGQDVVSENRNILLHAQNHHRRIQGMLDHCAETMALVFVVLGMYLYNTASHSGT